MAKYKKVLVTGGAGFIGSHLVDGLVKKGYRVRVMDSLFKQIHPTGKLPDFFNKKAEFFKGDVTKRSDWVHALHGIEAIYHFASAVGVGQSMYEIEHYVKVNDLGTAILLDILANSKHSIKKIIVAASMSSYGEGAYICNSCGRVRPDLRLYSQLEKRDFNVYCPECGKLVNPVATKEEDKQNSNSIYAITKKDQEEMILTFAKAYGIPSVALRFFNVYGSRQSLSNPYNGVVAIFVSRVKNNKAPIINEDGLQTRDFIHIDDVTAANILALERSGGDYHAFNIGSGKPLTIKLVAKQIANALSRQINVDITLKSRKLDVRHCYADMSKSRKMLKFSPKVTFSEGLTSVIAWSNKQEAVDTLEYSLKELEKRGLR